MQIFISYAHADKSDALYVRSIVDSVTFQFYRQVEISGKAIATTGAIAGITGALGILAAPGLTALATGLIVAPGMTYLLSNREEKEVMKRLVRNAKRQLEKRLSTIDIKLESWMDADIPAGADWNSEIKSAIETSNIFVLLVPSFASVNVGIEYGIAETKKKKTILIARSVDHLSRYNLSHLQALAWPDNSEEWRTIFVEALIATSKSILEEAKSG